MKEDTPKEKNNNHIVPPDQMKHRMITPAITALQPTGVRADPWFHADTKYLPAFPARIIQLIFRFRKTNHRPVVMPHI